MCGVALMPLQAVHRAELSGTVLKRQEESLQVDVLQNQAIPCVASLLVSLNQVCLRTTDAQYQVSEKVELAEEASASLGGKQKDLVMSGSQRPSWRRQKQRCPALVVVARVAHSGHVARVVEAFPEGPRGLPRQDRC